MPTTSNFGWTTPADTDYVKDGALAIRTLANGIDTSLVDLKGGTTGQILSKNSNTDLDYTWINNDQGDITNVAVTSPITGGGSSGSVTIGIQDGTTTQKGAVQLENSTSSTSTTTAAVPASVKSAYDLANAAIAKSLIDAEGDLIVGDAADAVQRLALGTNNQVLTVDTSVDGKIKWATPSSGAVVQVVSAVKSDTFTTSTNNAWVDVTGLSATITPTSASNKILVFASINMGGRINANPAAGQLVRGSTAIGLGDAASNRLRASFSTYISADDDYVGLNGHTFLDSPATTSATTYKYQVHQGSAAGTIYVNRGQADADNIDSFRTSSQIILMEVTP